MKLLLSINPEHVENILRGAKKFEFRKVESRRPVDCIVIYSTAPVSMIVGEVEVTGTVDLTFRTSRHRYAPPLQVAFAPV